MRKSSWLRIGLRVAAAAFIVAVAVVLGIAGWRVCGKFGERCEEPGQFFPYYNASTQRIDLVMYDVNKNGVIDTWFYPNGQYNARVDVDRNEDGKIDRILMLDRYSTLRLQPSRVEKGAR